MRVLQNTKIYSRNRSKIELLSNILRIRNMLYYIQMRIDYMLFNFKLFQLLNGLLRCIRNQHEIVSKVTAFDFWTLQNVEKMKFLKGNRKYSQTITSCYYLLSSQSEERFFFKIWLSKMFSSNNNVINPRILSRFCIHLYLNNNM